MKELTVGLWLLVMLPLAVLSQDEVLLTLDNQPVMRSDFERVYYKNSNIEGFENKPAREYLELFINFRLKVYEAGKLGYDTIPAFVTELAGYREQLAKPYLQDRPLIDSLVREAYYRTVNEINVSHIMAKLPASPAPADTLAAYSKIMDIRNRVLKGVSFEETARAESDDPSARINEGLLGWFSAFAMVFPFENAAYHLRVGEISLPVRTRYGYHIIRLNGIRPSPGEIKLAHIMIRAGRNDSQEVHERARHKADTCYKLLREGHLFPDLVKQYSEDAGTAKNGGQIRWLRSGELPPALEEPVFALEDSGSYSAPVQSDYGWHIFRLEGKRPISPFSQLKSQLEERIMADERGLLAEESMLSRIRTECGLLTYPENISVLASLMDSSVYSGNWNAAIAGDLIEPVFTISNRDYTQRELADYIVQTKRYRQNEQLKDIVNRKCTELINKELISFEKNQLEKKHPEFKYLLEEYHDGILLFNIMDSMVWSRAVSDTAGLRAFYMQHTNSYMWQERADISVYILQDESYLKATRKHAKKRTALDWSVTDMMKAVCGNDSLACIEISDHQYEKGESLPAVGLVWGKGSIKEVRDNEKIMVVVVNQILPPEPKSFHEVRGQVTADYQNFLDQQWIAALRTRYPVIVNDSVLNQIQ